MTIPVSVLFCRSDKRHGVFKYKIILSCIYTPFLKPEWVFFQTRNKTEEPPSDI